MNAELAVIFAAMAADEARFINSGNLRLWTERSGDPADPAVLLVMGTSTPGPGWPDELVTLLLASFTAFAIARLRIPGRKTLLIVFTAGNLLPPQVLITPLYTLYTLVPLPVWLSDSQALYDSYLGLILIHVAFQFGFCVFVLANFMRTIPE